MSAARPPSQIVPLNVIWPLVYKLLQLDLSMCFSLAHDCSLIIGLSALDSLIRSMHFSFDQPQHIFLFFAEPEVWTWLQMTSFSKSHVSRQVSWYFHYHSMESNTTENIECSVMWSEKISKMVVDFLETCLYNIPACFICGLTWHSDPGTNSNAYYLLYMSALFLTSLLTFMSSTLASIPSLSSWILRVVFTHLTGGCVTSWCSYFL